MRPKNYHESNNSETTCTNQVQFNIYYDSRTQIAHLNRNQYNNCELNKKRIRKYNKHWSEGYIQFI